MKIIYIFSGVFIIFASVVWVIFYLPLITIERFSFFGDSYDMRVRSQGEWSEGNSVKRQGAPFDVTISGSVSESGKVMIFGEENDLVFTKDFVSSLLNDGRRITLLRNVPLSVTSKRYTLKVYSSDGPPVKKVDLNKKVKIEKMSLAAYHLSFTR